MRTIAFKKMLSLISDLNTCQFRLLRDQINSVVLSKHVSVELETPISRVVCPHCRSKIFFRWGKRNDLQRYKCKSCKKTFNSLTSTPLARLRRKGHWLDYSECLKEGLTIRQAATKCQIHKSTSFRWRHRFIENIVSIKADCLDGIIEADETYFLRSNKGCKSMNREPRKRGGKAKKRGLSKEQVCVFISRDRNKNTFDTIFESFNSANLEAKFLKVIAKDALFCTDGKSVYKKFTKDNNIRHGFINLSKGEHVKKGVVHIQNVNAYHSRLKEWINIHFKGVATKYLNNYISWLREIDEFKDSLNPKTVLLRAKSGGKYKVQPLTMT